MMNSRPIKILSVLLVAMLFAVMVNSSLRIVEIRYPRAIENDPLVSPVRVQSASGTTLVLEDGRTFSVDVIDDPLDRLVEESNDQVDVELEVDGSTIVIYSKRRSWICGTNWVALVQIPLIPVDVPINRREPLGVAKLVTQNTSEVGE